MTVPKKDLLSLHELSSDDIHWILSTAADFKKGRLAGVGTPQLFEKKSAVMIFEKPSLRTRITFETAIFEMGGHPINLAADTIGMGKRETVADIARNLEKWVHCIIARTYHHDTVEKLARFSSIPVINALTDLYHPCQALAFAQTLFEKKTHTEMADVVFIGDANNVCNSIMVLCAKLGMNFTIVCPEKYSPDVSVLESCREYARKNGSEINVTRDIAAAVKNATAIYTDVWASMGQETEAEQRKKDFMPYQVNSAVIAAAPEGVLVSHCLPAHRGEEITSDVLDSENSIAFTEAENRLHVQKAAIAYLFS